MTIIADVDPGTATAYAVRFKRSTRLEGHGLEVVIVSPCPFCAAPDWQRWPIVDVYTPMQEDATCSGCGRSARHVVSGWPMAAWGSTSVTVELVQTGGEDPPDYLAPFPRRAAP